MIIPHITKGPNPIDIAGSVALVGNSDQLLKDAYGEQIDSHDCVIRFNLFKDSLKFQEHVGTKTDYVFFSRNIARGKFPAAYETRFYRFCKDHPIITYPDSAKYLKRRRVNPLTIMMDPEECSSALARSGVLTFNKYESKFTYPRAGMLMVAALVDSGIKPTLYGFDLSQRPEGNTHYYDGQLQTEAPACHFGHKPSMEYEHLAILRDMGLITITGENDVERGNGTTPGERATV